MKISTKGRYAIRCLVNIGKHSSNDFVSLLDIASEEEISFKYMEKIVNMLKKAGIVEAVRGAKGGYRLSKPTSEITLKDVLTITEGSLACVSCLQDNPNKCPRYKECSTVHVWEGLNNVIDEYLSSITIQDVIDKNKKGN
ncbi:MAG: Rrf2 family transcriptional regulator [Thomasclavelia sp.]|jgi:Rrf2 family protein|nr:Rrf2 family transcriptional regulator [Thomasclavelia sp.]